ncbi:MAG TPA: alpha/beta hydrolase [Ktedonobacterales bacterium]|nr:alpha/beta hydrolase [Ktedonobacterales bacterium]
MTTTQYLTLPEGRIAFDVQGEGPLVLCAPGIFDMRAEYRFLTPQLVQAGFRVATMDWRGLGETTADWPDYSVEAVGGDMLALIRHLGAQPASIVAHSYNSASAVCAATAAPELVAGLALHGPFVRDHGPQWQSRLINGLLFGGPWALTLWRLYYANAFPLRKPADFTQYFQAQLAMLRQPGRLTAMRKVSHGSFDAATKRLGDVQAPTLILMGSRDPDYKPQQEADWIAAHIPNSKVQMVEGAGHYLIAEAPEIAGPAIISFFQQAQHAGEASHGAAGRVS